MGSGLWSICFSFILLLSNTIFLPIFNILDAIVGMFNFTNYITQFNAVVVNYIEPLIGFFFQFMGPLTIDVILLMLAFYISLFTFSITLEFMLGALRVIKKYIPLA